MCRYPDRGLRMGAQMDLPPDSGRGGCSATMDLPAGASQAGAMAPSICPEPGQAPTQTQAPAPSHTTGERYVPKKFHARGGMGEIWLAEDSDIGRQVALKKMLKGAKPDQIERFLVEARITGQLEHPGIVPVHELGTNEKANRTM